MAHEVSFSLRAPYFADARGSEQWVISGSARGCAPEAPLGGAQAGALPVAKREEHRK